MAGYKNILTSCTKIITGLLNTLCKPRIMHPSERVEVLRVKQIGLELAQLQTFLTLLLLHVLAGSNTYQVSNFSTSAENIEDYGEGALNHALEVLWHRQNESIILWECSEGLTAVVFVLQCHIRPLPQCVVLQKWMHDLIATAACRCKCSAGASEPVSSISHVWHLVNAHLTSKAPNIPSKHSPKVL